MATITATAGSNGAISPVGVITVTDGEDQTFEFTSNEDYRILDVEVDSVSQGLITEYTFTAVTGSHTIDVTFEEGNYVITTDMADTYFEKTLNACKWDCMTDDEKTSALFDAEQDVITELCMERVYVDAEHEAQEEDPDALQKAVFEWALFLYENQDTINSAIIQTATNIKKKTVQGIGSEEYGGLTASNSAMNNVKRMLLRSSKAGQYLRCAVGNCKAIR